MSDRTMPALARKRFFLGYWMSGLLAIAWVGAGWLQSLGFTAVTPGLPGER